MRSLIIRYSICTIFICLLGHYSEAQGDIYSRYNIYRDPVRVFLNQFTFTVTSGYGLTNYQHDLSGLYFVQDNASQFIFDNGIEAIDVTLDGYTDWLNDPRFISVPNLETAFEVPYDYLENPVYNPLLNNEQLLINTDTTNLGFQGISTGIPINLRLHYNRDDLYRIGVGFSYEFHQLKELQPTALEHIVRPYTPNIKGTSYTRFYGMAGYKFYRFWWYDFVAELEIGNISGGTGLNSSAIQRGLYTNLGVSIENRWSEYFRLIFKPSVDIKNYTVSLPDGASIKHNYPTFQFQFGISIRFPDIRRSPMRSDHTQVKHIYRDPLTGRTEEVRGQPIWKRQNPKVGENHRKLLKYKGKNKKKLNPY